MEEHTAAGGPRSSSFQETIVTLPGWAVAGLGVLTSLAALCAIAVLIAGPEKLHEAAGSMLVVLLPMLFAVVAAIGVRRTSTQQIDVLVKHFLEGTVQDRLKLACDDHVAAGYPFKSVKLERPAHRRSYVRFLLQWAQGHVKPAQIDVKMNVYNIELITQMSIPSAALPHDVAETTPEFIERKDLHELRKHPLLKHFRGALQGSLEEGYAIRVSMVAQGEQLNVSISLRQKMQEHFLASPYLKRYFAEDLSIAVGVIYGELLGSGLLNAHEPAKLKTSEKAFNSAY